jgi:hypothetical protein
VFTATTIILQTALALVTIAPVSGGNSTTLPSQRHIVRIDTGLTDPTLLAAVQQDGYGGHGLGFFRSNDDGLSWSYYAAIQDDLTKRDTADLITVGNDIAIVYSYEGPDLNASRVHDTYFQWWRFDGLGDWISQPRVKVFNYPKGQYRAELARDSFGRLWVQAFALEDPLTSSSLIAVSSDNGGSFASRVLDPSLPGRGGGRLISYGSRLLFVWDLMSSSNGAFFRTRSDGDPVDLWDARQAAFSDGIYHGAALSALADGLGGVHLFYRAAGYFADGLFYRYFNGRSFGPPSMIENQIDWATQAATTLVGSDVHVFYNRYFTPTSYEIRYQRLSGGSFSLPVVLDTSGGFKGYPTAIATLPSSVTAIPCAFNLTPDASSGGNLVLLQYSGDSGDQPQ